MITYHAKKILSRTNLTLIGIESRELQRNITARGCRMIGTLRPIAVIVYRPEGIYSIDMEAKTTPLDQLRQRIPNLDEILSHLIRD